MADRSLEKVEVTAFDAARIKAIDAYGHIEAHQALLLHKLAGLDMGVAKTLIFRVTSTRARYAIVDDFVQRFSQDEDAKATWRLIRKKLAGLDDRRNSIVHWVGAVDLDADAKFLRDPRAPLDRSKTIDEVDEFTADCYAVGSMFMDLYFSLTDSSPGEAAT